MTHDHSGLHVLAVLCGGVAVVRALETLRELKKQGCKITTIVTASALEFITPLAVVNYTGGECFAELFDPKDDTDMGHIALSRQADLMLVMPATAQTIAKMAHGIADDLASTTLLAATIPKIVAPGMNQAMWGNPATRRNVAQIQADGVVLVPPEAGEMACGEYGVGRLASTHAIAQVVAQHATGNTARYATGNMAQHATGNMAQYATGDAAQYATQDAAQPAETVPLARNSMAHPALPVDSPDSVEQVVVPPLPQPQPAADGLKGLHALVTAGPTHEAIDPVRYISNASSGKQGFAVAEALANQGATVTLISGPVTLPTPAGVTRVDVTSALEMDSAVAQRLPCDIAVFVAAVADWHVPAPARDKLKKSDTSIATFPQTNTDEQAPPPRQFSLKLVETPDLLHTYSRHAQRPKLVIGFCLETANVETNAVAKWRKKQCDWMVVNALTADNRVFNANDNRAGILREYPADQPAPASHPSVDWWPKSSKQAIAERLVIQIVQWHEQQRQPS